MFLCLDDLVKVKNNVDDLLLPYEFDFCIYKNSSFEFAKRRAESPAST